MISYTENQAIYLTTLVANILEFQRRVKRQKTEASNEQALLEQLEVDIPHLKNAISIGDEQIKFIQLIQKYSDLIRISSRLSFGHHSTDLEDSIAGSNESHLQSIFDALFVIHPDKKKQNHHWHPVKALSCDDSVFAVAEGELNQNVADEYVNLWNTFTKEAEDLLSTKSSAKAYLGSLLSLLKKYTWCIPSVGRSDKLDISLYDHARTTAAIACCLHQSDKLQGVLSTGDEINTDKAERFSLLTGDLSGIQKFIYQINSKNAAKTLKGRSFFVQLISQSIVDKILTIYEIEDAHVLFNSGGRFQIIVPNNIQAFKQVQDEIDRINLDLLNQYDGILYIATGQKPFRAHSFLIAANEVTSIRTIAQEAQSELEREKRQRYQRLINPSFFDTQALPGITGKVCQATGLDLSDDSACTTDPEDGEVQYLHDSVQKQQDLGKALKNATYLVATTKRPHEGFSIQPYSEGPHYRFLKENELHKVSRDFEGLYKIMLINRTDSPSDIQHTTFSKASLHYLWYGGAWNPNKLDKKKEIDIPAEFEDIAKDEKVNQLGILRMDVDNLGSSFRDGFSDAGSSINRIATLSSMLDWFFSAYLHHLMESQLQSIFDSKIVDPNFNRSLHDSGHIRNHIYPVYAGGDDLFIVARWDVAIALAHEIRKAFARFTGHHPLLTISGGIAQVDPKYPIHQAAKLAEQAETEAKNLSHGEKKKNAICLYGQAVGWEDWDQIVFPMTKDMLMLQEQMGSKTIINLFRNLTAEYYGNSLAQSGKLEGQKWGSWRWRAAYRVKRLIKQYKDPITQEELEKLGGLGGSLFSGNYNGQSPQRSEHAEIMDFIPLLCRWLQNITRFEGKKQLQAMEEQR